MNSLVEKRLDELIVLCKIHRVNSIALFGSAASDTINDNSDIDFLVQFDDQIDVLDYADNYFSLLDQLQALLEREIDLISIKSLKNPILIQEISSTKVELYAA